MNPFGDQSQNLLSQILGAKNSKLSAIINQPDLVITITYLQQGTTDERINTVTYSSVLSGTPSATLTFGYNGASPYSVLTVTYS